MERNKSVNLTCFKYSDGHTQMVLTIEPQEGEQTSYEESAEISRAEIIRTFFETLYTTTANKLYLNGIKECAELTSNFNENKPFFINKLIHDLTTDKSLVDLIIKKCLSLNSVKQVMFDKSIPILNWENLPVTLADECIKHMTFGTKMAMRRVSKREKQLVEEKKHVFKTVFFLDYFSHSLERTEKKLMYEDYSVASLFNSKDTYDQKVKQTPKRRSEGEEEERLKTLMKNIYQFGTIEHLYVHVQVEDQTPGTIEEWHSFANSFNALKFSIFSDIDEIFEHYMENYEPGAANCFAIQFPNDIFSGLVSPATLNKLLAVDRLQYSGGFDVPIKKFCNNWIRTDAKIDKQLVIGARSYSDRPGNDYPLSRSQKRKFVQKVERLFESRMIGKSEDVIRISTNNPAKNILFKFFGYTTADVFRGVVVRVVAANSNDFEFDHGFVDDDENTTKTFY